MVSLAIFVVTTALFDSFSTGQQIILFVLLLATSQPVRNSLTFLAGLSISYLLCGIVGFLHLDQVNAFIAQFFPSLNNVPDQQYYLSQSVTALIFVAVGPIYWFRTKNSSKTPLALRLLALVNRITPVWAIGIGVFFSVSSFPVAIPYIASLEKIFHAGIATGQSIGMIALYNLFYAMPMLVIFGLFLIFRHTIENLEQKLHVHADYWNRVLTVVLFSGMGLFFLADSICWIALGHPIFKGRFLM